VPRSDINRKLDNSKPFAELKRYSLAQVAENNLYCKFLSTLPDCSSWVEDVLRELLPVFGGNELHITLASEVNSEQKQTLVFAQKEISIGRAPTSDIPLPLQSISRHHARIVERDGSFYIEDLHSVSGTFVNGSKLDPAHSCLLSAGDEVRMHPYILRVTPKDLWTRDDEVRVKSVSSTAYLDSKMFISSFGPDACLFELGLHSDIGNTILAISRPLLEVAVARLMRTTKDTGTIDADGTLIEFVAVCILERINRTLQFPFEFSLCPLSGLKAKKQSGLMFETAIQLSSKHGHVRIFLPGSVLEKLAHDRSSFSTLSEALLSWQLVLSVGSVGLCASEMRGAEPGDTLIYTPALQLLLPAESTSAAPRRGWQVSRSEEDPLHFVIHTFHEWGLEMTQEKTLQKEKAKTGEVDLSALPVHIHVVLARVEMSLQELQTFSPGSIVQLDEQTNSTVQLVSGNTLIGSGELVSLEDGRMGVKITRWREQ
jgi:flagellar motor switch/type III secretory pathway protein FliN/pSer/pThr/pTyr-binding forkhead associated (FHA) protein